MPWFEYHALTQGGTVMTGRLEAGSHDAARAELDAMRLDIRELNAAEAPAPVTRGLGHDDLAFFNEQLAAMADAGIALDDGLAQLGRDVESPRLRGWINDLVTSLRQGQPLEQAIAERESHLPMLYSQVVRAGVQTGQLPATLLNLNEHLRLVGRTRRLIWETISYPLVVVGFALLIMGSFLLFVVPKFEAIFIDFDTRLPTITRLIIDMGRAFPTLLTILVVLAIVGLVLWWTLRFSPGGRRLREQFISIIPGLGKVLRASLIARFMRGVATGVSSGLPLPESIRLGAGATGSPLLMGDAEQLARTAERGASVFEASRTTRVIPPMFGFCVQSARSQDALPTALGKLARSYELRADHAQGLLRVMLLPLVTVLLGGFIGLCITGMFLPLVSLLNSMTG